MATPSNGKKQQKITHLGDLLDDTLAYSSSWGSWRTVLSLSFRSMRTRRRFQYSVYGARDRAIPLGLTPRLLSGRARPPSWSRPGPSLWLLMYSSAEISGRAYRRLGPVQRPCSVQSSVLQNLENTPPRTWVNRPQKGGRRLWGGVSVLKYSSSSGVEVRPSISLRCGWRPKRAITSRAPSA
jgi:hypothetical protein